MAFPQVETSLFQNCFTSGHPHYGISSYIMVVISWIITSYCFFQSLLQYFVIWFYHSVDL